MKRQLTFNQVIGYVTSNRCSPEQMAAINRAFALKMSLLRESIKRSLNVGDQVVFRTRFSGELTGRVVKVESTADRILVRVVDDDRGTWRINIENIVKRSRPSRG